MNNPFAAVAQFAKPCKQADIDPVTAKALSDIGSVALLSAGAGVAGRSAVGAYNLVRRTLAPHKVKYPGAVTTTLPYPVIPNEPEPEMKIAADAPWYATPDLWAPPAMAGAGLAGAFGGWKVMDSLLERRRKSEEDSETDKAKNDFRSALLQNYNQPRSMTMKMAADLPEAESLSVLLDKAFDAFSKQGSWQGVLGQYLGGYAVPTAAITGMMAYTSANKTNQAKVTERAMNQRLRRNYAARPSEIFATPEPVITDQRPGETDEDQDTLAA